MTLLETIISIEAAGLVRRHLGEGLDRNTDLIRHSQRTFINEGEVVCFVESEHAGQEEQTNSLDDAAPEEGEAIGYEISDKDWEVMHSVDSGNGRDVDPLDIDWLRQAGLIEGSADSVRLNRMAKDWIHGNTNDDFDSKEA